MRVYGKNARAKNLSAPPGAPAVNWRQANMNSRQKGIQSSELEPEAVKLCK